MQHLSIPLNLSREPFRRDRPILVASAVVSVVLLLLLTVLLGIIWRERGAAAETRGLIERYDRQLRTINSGIGGQEGFLRQPDNEVVLERGAFLNQLLQRKGISWTRLFADLQTVFPNAVRLVSVRPYITQDSRVQLDMVVGAQAPQPVIDLVRRFENSAIFGATVVQGWMPPSQNEPLYRYRLSVNYGQKL